MTVTLSPIRRALIAVDSRAASRISAPNYDEFQSDTEVWELIRQHPESVLGITMPHCNAETPEQFLEEGSAQALSVASDRMKALIESPLTREAEDLLWVYEITSPNRPGVRQIGLGGMAQIDEIRTPDNPGGSIIRNEGVREKKARGRADLIRATNSFLGVVNNAVDDSSGAITSALEGHAGSRPPDLEVSDHHGNRHRVWLLTEPATQERLRGLLAEEPHAYVADGNHRSAAAAMLGSGEFSAVFFPARNMGLAPYNRLVDTDVLPEDDLERALARAFTVEALEGATAYQPRQTHHIGLYVAGAGWRRLVPRPESYDPDDAVQDIDAEIVQRHLFAPIFGITDPTDDRLHFVGGDREAQYLQDRVDRGEFGYAVTLPPVTMAQFTAVCRQNRIMPPKSTWFEPKVRSGLVIALRD